MGTVLEKEQTVAGSKILYEAILVIKSSMVDEDISKEVDKMKATIERGGGEVVRLENMGKKKLAYEVRKEKKGIYIMIHFKGGKNAVSDLQRTCRLNETVIKFMMVKIDPKDLPPPPEIKNAAPLVKEGKTGL